MNSNDIKECRSLISSLDNIYHTMNCCWGEIDDVKQLGELYNLISRKSRELIDIMSKVYTCQQVMYPEYSVGDYKVVMIDCEDCRRIRIDCANDYFSNPIKTNPSFKVLSIQPQSNENLLFRVEATWWETRKVKRVFEFEGVKSSECILRDSDMYLYSHQAIAEKVAEDFMNRLSVYIESSAEVEDIDEDLVNMYKYDKVNVSTVPITRYIIPSNTFSSVISSRVELFKTNEPYLDVPYLYFYHTEFEP